MTTALPPTCTYCGKPAIPVTKDDVFPKTLWADDSGERPIKVPSCKKCNNESNESILKHIFVTLDSRFHKPTLKHLKDRRGAKDLETFQSIWIERKGKGYV